MRLAVLCPSEIAHRRFMPALELVPDFEFAGVGTASPEERLIGLSKDAVSDEDVSRAARQRKKAKVFADDYGGVVYESYNGLLADVSVEAVYIPMPPALHHPWAKRALEAGKHVMVEKPFTISVKEASELVSLSEERDLAVHENYMFAFHSQIEWIREQISAGTFGETRLIRVDFGFPFRGSNDFRYSRELGGGALLDCGGYTLKLAAMLLGDSARVSTSRLNYGRNLSVDLYGSATLENLEGQIVQVSFGMDNDYRCNIDLWGSEATLRSGRVLTAPVGFEPIMVVSRNGEEEVFKLPSDDSFRKSIEHFAECVKDGRARAAQRREIIHQAELVDSVFREQGL